MRIRAEGRALVVESTAFTARFEGAALTSLIARGSDIEFCRGSPPGFPLEMFYVWDDVLGEDKHQSVAVKALSDLAARVVVTGNDSDRELFVRLDPESGDLCVRPSGQSARRGVMSIRWKVAFAPEARLVLPCVNGILVEAGRDFPKDDRFQWPYRWNAQLVIAERDGASMMVHSEDEACKFKALKLARHGGLTTLGFESEQVGPVWENRTGGGVEWRINIYDGDWRGPADRYREWMRRIYALESKRAARPDWVGKVDFAVCWCHSKPEILEALARIHPPGRTLIHLSRWRTSDYDIDYPDYFPSEEARSFLNKANEMGFKVMPHFNYFACHERHPFFARVRDWQLREPGKNLPQGWYWPVATHDYTRMAYIHPGLALWRRTIIDAVMEACRELDAPAAFLDQTLCTWNTDNAVVENMTTVEGMRQMQEEFAAIEPGIVLAGEGLDEISFQRQCFAQAHIHDGWGGLEPHHIEAAHPICSRLWKGHTRLVGYHHLSPKNKDVDTGIEVYRRMGAIPTLICNDPESISMENPTVRKIVELAAGEHI